MKMIVAKAFRPKGSNSPEVKVGDELDLTESQARVFKAVGFVKDPSAQPAPPPPAAAVKTVQAAPVAAKKTSRTYLRRDMTAQPSAPAAEPSAAEPRTATLPTASDTPPADE